MSEQKIETEVAVLGGGPGGYAAAFLAADRGLHVTLIDAAVKPGGTCLNVGCIPSKALLHAAHLITAAREAGDFGITFAAPKFDINVLRAKKDKIIGMHSNHLLDLCKKRNVTFLSGRGVFTGPQTIQVGGGLQNGNFQERHYRDRIGAHPTSQLEPGQPSAYWISTSALQLDKACRPCCWCGRRRRLHRSGNGNCLRRPGQQGDLCRAYR